MRQLRKIYIILLVSKSSVVEFVSFDNRAFELVSGNGFIHLSQKIFDAGKDFYKSQVLTF